MSELVDRLAELTAHRDRDVLDATLVSALAEMLDSPQLVAVHRCVNSDGVERWLTRARMVAGDIVASADGSWTDFESLPQLDERPAWRDCLRAQTVQTGEGPPATVLFPLVSDGGAVGVLEVRHARPLLPSERRSVSSILRITRNIEGLLDYSERDTLTGLLNRKTFDDAFLKLVRPTAASAAASASGDPAAERRIASATTHYLGVVDIDHFKRVNDRFGHIIGDEVLLLLSRVMRATFRYHDRLYRFGGEEFVVLLRCAEVATATAALERLRSNLAQHPFPQVGHITVSTGFTAIYANDTPTSAFGRADRALYFAKGHGRDRVCGHAALVASGQLVESQREAGDVELF